MNAPLVPSDLYRLVMASAPQCAKDGVVYFVRAWLDESANETRTAIWRVAPGEDATPFSTGTSDRGVRISPDGKYLAFIGERGDGKRVRVLGLEAGGEARAVTPAYDAVAGIAWSADSRSLAYVATVALDAKRALVAVDERSGARHIRGLPFKSDDDGLLDGRRKHLFTVRLGGDPAQLTRGEFDAGPPAWSPDGSQLAFVARVGMPETSFIDDLFVIAAEGGDPRRLTRSRGPASSPAFSHGGEWIAYVGHENGDDPAGRVDLELLVIPSAGGEARSLSANCGRTLGDWIVSDTRTLAGPSAPEWSADDARVFALVSDGGRSGVRSFSWDGTSARAVVDGERDVTAFSLGPGDGIAFTYSDPLVPSAVALVESGAERRLTDLNPWLRERALRTPRRLLAHALDGTSLEAWVIDAGEPGGPLVLEVHGGPHAAYGWAFFFEFQMLASLGMSVAYGNPRGSQSYGTAFASAISHGWGDVDASDVEAILDAVLEEGRYDRARVALVGGSYGGFMTTWLLGHTKRFACGVSMRAVNDLVSEVGASDLGWFLEKETTSPWDDGGRRLFERSPMRSAHEIDAPLLVLHSERDYRCPIDQGEQLFTLLRRLGKTVEFVRFTSDGHNLARSGKPRNRVLHLRATAQWVGRHLRPSAHAFAAPAAGSLFEPLMGEAADQLPVPS